MPKFIIDPVAEDEIWDIWLYIAQDNPEAANRVMLAAFETFQVIADSPNIGKNAISGEGRSKTCVHGIYLVSGATKSSTAPFPAASRWSMCAIAQGTSKGFSAKLDAFQPENHPPRYPRWIKLVRLYT